MTDREQSCAERIGAQLASRADDVRKMLAAQSGDTLCVHCGQVIEEVDTLTTHITEGDAVVGQSLAPRWIAVGGGAPCSVLAATPGTGYRSHELDEDYTEDSLAEFGLCLSRKVVLRFDMSTGGPADWLEIVCEEEKRSTVGYGIGSRDEFSTLMVERVVYHFADWWDHAEEAVDLDSPLWQLAEDIAEGQS